MADLARSWWAPLIDLIVPVVCAGCGDARDRQLCGDCAEELASARPRHVAPDPIPPGLPACVALGAYQGVLRALLLAYKERGAYLLDRRLGAALARSVTFAVDQPGRPVALVGVPSTPSAVRVRHGDHVARLGRRAAHALRAAGCPAAFTGRVLRALPKADSSHLDAAARLAAAQAAFAVRPGPVGRLVTAADAGAAVIVVDDIVTTGATLAAACRVLADAGVRVDAAATIAATRRRRPTRLTAAWAGDAGGGLL